MLGQIPGCKPELQKNSAAEKFISIHKTNVPRPLRTSDGPKWRDNFLRGLNVSLSQLS